MADRGRQAEQASRRRSLRPDQCAIRSLAAAQLEEGMPSWSAVASTWLRPPRQLVEAASEWRPCTYIHTALTGGQHIGAYAARSHCIHPDLVGRQRERHAAAGRRGTGASCRVMRAPQRPGQ